MARSDNTQSYKAWVESVVGGSAYPKRQERRPVRALRSATRRVASVAQGAVVSGASRVADRRQQRAAGPVAVQGGMSAAQRARAGAALAAERARERTAQPTAAHEQTAMQPVALVEGPTPPPEGSPQPPSALADNSARYLPATTVGSFALGEPQRRSAPTAPSHFGNIDPNRELTWSVIAAPRASVEQDNTPSRPQARPAPRRQTEPSMALN